MTTSQSKNPYKPKFLLLAALIIAGCSAHRPISGGAIPGSQDWLHTYSSLEGRMSFQHKEGKWFSFYVMACNEKDKQIFSVVPPLPLSRVKGSSENAKFLVGIEIHAKNHEDRILLNTSEVLYTSPKGDKVTPSLVSIGQDVCTIEYEQNSSVSGDLRKRTWVAPADETSVGSSRRLFFTLLFDAPTPSVDEKFQLDFNGFLINGKFRKFPTITYSRDTAWGGW